MEAYSVVSIVCPNCGTSLEPSEDVCHRCGARTASSAAESAAESAAPRARLMDRPWLLIVVVLHLGVLGIPLYWKTRYSTPARLAIIGASVVYTVLAVALIAWGSMYIFGQFRALAR